MKVVLDDLRISFAKILGVNLFGKKLAFTYLDKELDSSKSLLDQENSTAILQLNPLVITIRFIEIGA